MKQNKKNKNMSEQSISACSDVFIKYLFGSEGNNDILLSFINSVLVEAGYEKAVKVQVLNPFNIKEFFGDKESILDVKATDAFGRIFDIEVQTGNTNTFLHRSLYYWADLYAAQINHADFYLKLKPVICINILTQNLLPTKHYFNTFAIKEKSTGQPLTEHLSINFIELRKLISVHSDKPLEKLSYYLKNEGTEDITLSNLIENDPILKKAHENYSRFNCDAKLREIYKNRLKFLRDKEMYETDAREKGFEKGLAEGLAEGLEEGREKGRVEGLAKGREEGREKGREEGREEGLEEGKELGIQLGLSQGVEQTTTLVAKKLLKLHTPIDIIVQATNLSKEEIEKLK